MASKFSFNALKRLNTALMAMNQVRFHSWMTIQASLIVSHNHCNVSLKQWKNFWRCLPTSWSNWTKRTIKFLFYLLSWLSIIQAGRVELYFIEIDTSIWSGTRVNIIRVILIVLPHRFQTTWKCSVAKIILDIIHWSSTNIIWIVARHGWNQYMNMYIACDTRTSDSWWIWPGWWKK